MLRKQIEEKKKINYDKETEQQNEIKLSNKDDNKTIKKYNEIDNYKPSGNLIYGQDLFDKIENKIRKEK